MPNSARSPPLQNDGPLPVNTTSSTDGSTCATVNAARLFPSFDDRGTLNVGAPADIALLELREGSFEFLDNYKGTRTGKQRLVPAGTVLGGKPVASA